MKKMLTTTLIALSITFVFAFTVFSDSNGIFKISNYSVKLGNSIVKLQYPMYLNNDRIYVSLRSICDELKIPLNWNAEKGEAKIDIYHKKIQTSDKTQVKEEGVVPDEETALIVGKAILEKYAGKSLEYETAQKIYNLSVNFIETENAWQIMQTFKYKDGRGWSASGVYFPSVKINKNSGEIMYINTFSSLDD